jgi:hypothetical protein
MFRDIEKEGFQPHESGETTLPRSDHFKLIDSSRCDGLCRTVGKSVVTETWNRDIALTAEG